MLKLFYSNDIDLLVRSLTRELGGGAPGPPGPFAVRTVIIPNANIETYLKLEIARRTGIFAGVRFLFLERFLSDLVSPRGSRRLALDRRTLQNLLINLFLDDAARGALPRAVLEYLGPAGQPGEDRSLRAFQLADHLSRLFEEYALSRPEMLEEWSAGRATLPGGQYREAESWQRGLWLLLFGRGGRLERIASGRNLRFLLAKDHASIIASEQLVLPPQVHLFGFSYVSRSHNRIIEALSRRTEVAVYALNPCREFWEDVLTQPEAYKIRQRYLERSQRLGPEALLAEEDPFHLDDTEGSTLLGLWGRPGRENIHILNDMTECEFRAEFRDPLEQGYSLLRLLQHEVLHREVRHEDPPAGYRPGEDRSLQVLECPDVRREVEIIASGIWELVRESGTAAAGGRLRFNDIAVIIANAREFDTYCAHIASVFREVHGIPHTISDLSTGGSRIAEAAGLLLSLPQSGLTRSDVLGVLTHPACLNRFPDADPEEWVRWCDELSICHGASSGDHQGTYIAKDLYNWDQGIRRLVLGAFLEGERSGETRTFIAAGSGSEYLPLEISRGSQANAGLLAVLLRSLFSDISFLRSAELSLAEWAPLLSRFITTYLKADTAEDEHTLMRCLGEIAGLARLDHEDRPVPYGIAREFCLAAIGSLTLAKGQYLANGVAVSSFLPMRPLPFRAVFIAGLGEGLFPAREMKSPLDLRNARRIAGDVSGRERDQYNFLETLISTRDRLTLSYVSRDSQTGEPLEPSSVIKELRYFVEQGHAPSAAAAFRPVRHPLRRYDAAYFPGLYGEPAQQALPNHSPAARKEARTAALKLDLKRRLRERGLPADRSTLEPQCGGRLSGLLHPVRIPSGPARPGEEAVRVPIHAVRRFLESPLQGWAGFQLGLREEDYDDRLEVNDEVFATERLHALALLRRAYSQALREPDLPAAFDRACAAAMARNELKGISPTGVFQRSELARNAARLRAWWHNAGLAGAAEVREWRTARFGRADEHDAADEQFPPLVLEIPGCGPAALRVELFGTVENISADRRHTLTLIDRKSAIGARDYLRGFLGQVIFAAAGHRPGQTMQATVVSTASGGATDAQVRQRARTIPLPAISADRARSYLAGVIGDLLTEPHAYLLPIEAAITFALDRKNRKPLEEIVLDHREAGGRDGRAGYSCLYGPVPEPADYGPPSEPAAAAIIERRLGLFFEAMPEEW